MADNVNITPGTGATIATDDDGTAQHQYVKLEFGADNTQTKVSTSNPLPVTLANASTGSMAVYFDQSAPTVKAQYGSGTFLIAFDRANPSVNVGTPTIASITNTVAVYFDRGNPSVNIGTPTVFTNAGSTASIFTVSGSAAGVGVSGNTIISPSANYNFKIFAFQLTSTAQVNLLAKFTSGAASGATEFWRMPLWAPAQGVMGGNLAVTPPGYIFATGVNVTLALLLDSASLVHYSVSYIKETS